jgi:hypothetical protein
MSRSNSAEIAQRGHVPVLGIQTAYENGSESIFRRQVMVLHVEKLLVCKIFLY